VRLLTFTFCAAILAGNIQVLAVNGTKVRVDICLYFAPSFVLHPLFLDARHAQGLLAAASPCP